jgi:hypothetical protein
MKDEEFPSFSLIEFDGANNEIRRFNLKKDPVCKICG